ncbi:hypothetical protein GCM10010191_49340 [Actinomadura vinacea]|uniref:Uncharacterized protein n=1 Tax=Actinomadura vinacea TaxID=115336 RepID=A0ABN3JIY2_9ACTN
MLLTWLKAGGQPTWPTTSSRSCATTSATPSRPVPTAAHAATPARPSAFRAARPTITFPRPDGEQATLAPLPLATLLEAVPGLELFQIVQTAPTTLRIRTHPALHSDPDALWHQNQTRLSELLAHHDLDHIYIEPPQPNAGGKYRAVIAAAPSSMGSPSTSVTVTQRPAK